MTVLRVGKNQGCTVMPNHPLRDTSPASENQGPAITNAVAPGGSGLYVPLLHWEKTDAIRQAIRALEQAGYMPVRGSVTNEEGCREQTM